MSILSLNNVSLNLAGQQILNNENLQIQPLERIALVGRNGAGKSTLLKLIQGLIVPDKGEINKVSNLSVKGLAQEVPIEDSGKVYNFLVKDLGEKGEVLANLYSAMAKNLPEKIAYYQQQLENLDAWDMLPKITAMATALAVDVDMMMQNLSGGMKRRALLAAALIAEPDLLILDEPTNHLDLKTIEWLEGYLKNYSGALLLVTHDRQFLKNVAKRIIEIDRGKLNNFVCDYDTYLERRDAMRQNEQKQNALFDKQLSEEEAWLRSGIKARRTRNEGRVRALSALRLEYKQRRTQTGNVEKVKLEAARSGKMVLEATNINYSLKDQENHKLLIKDFSLLLMRGDKLGIIGPNGCGKTTLIRILLGELSPDSGDLRHGSSLKIAYFDQLRRELNEEQTVMANVADGSDFVTINGKSKHVASYLRDFLFSSDTFNKPVSVLSGGERNRLLLAKLFAKSFNVLVMDEPTNDLDIETLELLEAMLHDFNGTLLLISHDRAFLNNVVTGLLVHENESRFNLYIGGYDDYQRVSKARTTNTREDLIVKKKAVKTVKLNYNEQRELAKLPAQIETIEKKITSIQNIMAEPDFYQQENEKITEVLDKLKKEEQALANLYTRWEELENFLNKLQDLN